MSSTNCRNCVFAVWDKNTQVDCQFDRIDKFEENGAEILGQDDGKKQYFVIKNRFCNCCRDNDWGKKHKRKEWREIVEKQIEIQLDIIITVSPTDNLSDILTTVDSVYLQKIKPKSLIVALTEARSNSAGNVPSFYTSDLIHDLKNREGIPWRVEQISLQNSIKLSKSTYFTTCKAGYIFPADCFAILNRAINVDMKRFVAVRPDENGNRLVLMRLAGSSLDEVIEKSEEFGGTSMIIDYEDLASGTE